MTEIRYLIDPEPIGPELKNTTIGFFFDQRQRERVAIKSDRLLVSMRGALDRDVRAAGKLWAVDVGNHDKILDLRFTIANWQLAIAENTEQAFHKNALQFGENFLRDALRFFPRRGLILQASQSDCDQRIAFDDVEHNDMRGQTALRAARHPRLFA
jgi:hypothetical protein